MSQITDHSDRLDTIPTATPEQWAAARRYVETNAPDLAGMIFGGES